MTDKPHETHNRLAQEFVMKVVRETKTDSEMMVVIESVIFATMLVLAKVHKMSPGGSIEMVEMAMHQATERFASELAKQ